MTLKTAENSALPSHLIKTNTILEHYKYLLKYRKLFCFFNVIISHYCCFYCILDEVNAALESIRDCFQKY